MDKFLIKKFVKNNKNSTPEENLNNELCDNTDNEPPLKKPRFVNKFNDKWRKLYDWLHTETNENGQIVMFCTFCKDSSKRTLFGKEGCTTYKASTLQRHNECKDHIYAMQNFKSKVELKASIKNTQAKNHAFLISCLKTAHFIAINELPNSIYPKLQDFMLLQGSSNAQSSSSVQYRHSQSINELHEAIATTIKDEFLNDVNKANAIAIITDETCDIANIKHLGINIRYVKDGAIHIKFLENIEICDGTAITLIKSIKDSFEKNSLQFEKIVALGCDGANAMLGKKGGLVAHLQKENSYLIAVHCAAHRLALVLQNAIKDVPAIKIYNDTLKNIFIYFNSSAVRCSRLKEIQKLLESPTLKYAELHSIRWLSMHNAINIIFKTLDALVVFLESEVSAGRDTLAHGLLKAVKNPRFIYISHALMDILPIISTLNKIFQKDMSDFSIIKPCVKTTISKFNILKENIGKNEKLFFDNILNYNPNEKLNIDIYLDHFDDENRIKNYYSTMRDSLKGGHKVSRNEFNKIKVNFIQSLITSMNSRFSQETLDILECFSAYDPSTIKIAGLEKCIHFVNQLQDHFKSFIGLNSLADEYSDVFILLTNNYSNLKFANVADIFINKYKTIYPSTILMYEIALVIPISSGSVERSFSTQNRIKNKFRNRLAGTTLNNLIRIADSGINAETFDYEKAAQIFNHKVMRRF